MRAPWTFGINSTFKTYWEMFIISLALIISLVLPISIAFKPPYSESESYQLLMLAIDLLFFIDILFNFRSATFDIMSGEEISEPREIAFKYLFSMRFMLDVLSCLPWDEFGTTDIFHVLGLFKIVRVFRLGGILQQLNVKSGTKIVRILIIIHKCSSFAS